MKDNFERYLIEAVKKQPVLYNRNFAGYNNKENVEAAWMDVYKDVSKNVKNVNIIHCKLRWRTLRDRFVKQISIAPDGSEHFTAGAKKWEYTNQLSFLAQHLKKRKCDELCLPMAIKMEEESTSHHNMEKCRTRNNSILIGDGDDGRPHSFSFVETNSIQMISDSHNSRSHFLSESEALESEFEPEIDMPGAAVAAAAATTTVALAGAKRTKFETSNFHLQDNLEIDEFVESEPIPIAPALPLPPPTATISTSNERTNMKIHLSESSLSRLLNTTTELLQQQIKQNSRKSPNDAYFKVLDGYFAKLHPNDLDSVKVEILNLVLSKRKVQ